MWLPLPKGRAIRHRGDYSSIVLCDRRYSRPATLSKLPTWIKDRTSTYTNFGPAFAALRKVRIKSKPVYQHYITVTINLFISCPYALLYVLVLPGKEAEAGVVLLLNWHLLNDFLNCVRSRLWQELHEEELEGIPMQQQILATQETESVLIKKTWQMIKRPL